MLAALMAAGLGTVVAVPVPPPSDYAARALIAGRYDRAESQLAARLTADPAEPSALLNAAYLYERTGRAAAARNAYGTVLEGENILMDLASGRTAWSHDLARTRLGHMRMASR